MSQISGYILSLVACAVLCGIINGLFSGKQTTHCILRIITGIITSVVVISPLIQLRIQDIDRYFTDISIQSQTVAAQGSDDAEKELRKIIKENTQAYILDKATEFGMTLKVDVQLSDAQPPVPVRVRFYGNASSYNKQRLEDYIASQLSIPKEQQIWN